MTENRETLVILVQALIGLIVFISTLLGGVIIWLALKARAAGGRNGNVFCGRCGERVSETPTSAIALTDKAYYVYRCNRCRTETLLAQDPRNSL